MSGSAVGMQTDSPGGSPSLSGSTVRISASLRVDFRHLFLAFRSGLMANTFLILAVCIYLNKNGSTGPHLDKKKVQQLPDHFGPARASVVLQQAVQACIDCAYHQKTVFSFLKQGHGGEVISGETWPAVLCHQRWHHKNSLVGQCLLLSLVQSQARDRQAISLLSSLPNIVSGKWPVQSMASRHGCWRSSLQPCSSLSSPSAARAPRRRQNS